MADRTATRRPTAPLALALAWIGLAIAFPASAQPPTAAPTATTTWSWGLRAGLFEMVNSPDAYDAVFGDPMPRIGLQIEADRRTRWRFAASLDVGRVDGERVFLSDPPRGAGIEEELTMIPLHLTAAYRFRPQKPWGLYAGLGPSLLHWTDETDFDSASGTDAGGSIVVGARRQRPAGRWRLGGELRWSTFPGALPDGGVAGFFGEDDPGGLSLSLLALRRF